MQRKFLSPLKSPQDSSPFRSEAGEPVHRNNGGIRPCTEVSSGGGKLKQIDREKSLRSLMTVNLLKRLESSVASFRITLKKLQQIHLSTLSRIENFRKTGQDGTFADISATFEDASPDEDLEFFDPEEVPSDQQTGGKVNIQLGDMDLASWEHDLKADLGLIETLLGEMEKVSPADDAKLQHLKEHILAKIEAPINPDNRKLLVFTAFADTADYVPCGKEAHCDRRETQPGQA